MAKLFFYYGTMNSGKSFEALKVAYNYEEQGKKVVVLAPTSDKRSGVGQIKSRVKDMSREVTPIDYNDNIYTMMFDYQDVSCVIIDEDQFLTKIQVLQLTYIVDSMEIPVMAFGLKNDYNNQLFEGSETLLLHADKLYEVKTICWYCGRKATMNLRTNSNLKGQIAVGGNEDYKAVCRRHYKKYVEIY